MDTDKSLENFYKIIDEFANFIKYRGEASEADTRVKLIDRVLKDVLGWEEKYITREDKSESGYRDYTLEVNGRKSVVVEAKREGKEFIYPVTKNKHLKIDGTLTTNDNIKKVINQVRGYCDDNGIRYAVATNGYSWIVFRAISEEIPWREGSARVFPSIEYIIENFVEFYNLLSIDGISKGSLDSEFGKTAKRTRGLYRVVDTLYNSDLPLTRNRLNNQLQPIISKFFESIADQVQIEILRKCYVHSKSLKIIAHDLGVVIKDEIPKFMESDGVEQVWQGAKDSGKFGENIERFISSDTMKLILILGGIGCGKTTFLKRYQRMVGKELLTDNSIWFHIDFLSAPELENLEKYVYQEILNQMRLNDKVYFESRQNIKRAYTDEIKAMQHVELKNLTEGSIEYEKKVDTYIEDWRKDIITYVQKLLQIAKPKKELKVVLFMDNVDQLDADYQSHIFLLAQHITRKVKSITIIAMREESFYTTKIQRTFKAYTNKKFHIASPRFKHLIAHRIDYTLEILNKPDEEIIPLEEMDISSIKDFLSIVKTSIFEHNKEIVRFVESLCFGNMRQALEWFTLFLTSGCTDVDKMLRIYRRDGNYNVAFHEFVKSIMLGDKKYYREEKSNILNIFDCGNYKNSSHFTALRVLRFLIANRAQHTAEGKGFYEIGSLLSIFEDIFDNKEDLINTLNKLVTRQLVEINTKSTESIKGASHVRVTSAGWYYIKYLINEFSYLDLVLQDTPFNEYTIMNEMEKSVQKVDNMIDKDEEKIERMTARFERVEYFLNYLKKEEESENMIYSLNKLDTIFKDGFIPIIETFYYRKKEWILKRLIQNREKYAEELNFYEEEVIFEDYDYEDELNSDEVINSFDDVTNVNKIDDI